MIEVRQLAPDDWQRFKEIRLRALQQDPGVFSSNFQREAVQPDEHWQNRLQSERSGLFGVFDGPALIGLTGVSLRSEDPSGQHASLVASWLEPDYRGKGISRQMYQARIAWATAHPTCEILEVGIRESNIASKRACQHFGFELVNEGDPMVWPDGTTESMHTYTLRVK